MTVPADSIDRRGPYRIDERGTRDTPDHVGKADRRALMPPSVRSTVGGIHPAVWAVPSGPGSAGDAELDDPDVQREKVRCVVPLEATSAVTR